MQRTRVESSCVRAVGYDPAEQLLEIEFTNWLVYDYLSVPPAVHRGLMRADSHGRYFNRRIRDHYEHRRIGDGRRSSPDTGE
jgi:hypothetical protein